MLTEYGAVGGRFGQQGAEQVADESLGRKLGRSAFVIVAMRCSALQYLL